MDRVMIEARLAELRREFEGGQKLMRELEAKQMEVRDTLLRIGGAMQVLEELLGGEVKTTGPIAEAQAARVPGPRPESGIVAR